MMQSPRALEQEQIIKIYDLTYMYIHCIKGGLSLKINLNIHLYLLATMYW